MSRLKWILPTIAFIAASAVTFANAQDRPTGAPPDPVITAVDQPSVDAVTSPSAVAPAPENVQAIARVLAIETADPTATMITAFALFLPSRPRPVLALASPFVLNPYDDGVPVAVKLWSSRLTPHRLNC